MPCSITLHLVPLKQGLSVSLELGWQPALLTDPPVYAFPQLWGPGATTTLASEMDAGDSNTDPNAWAASDLNSWATFPAPSPLISKFRN